MSATMIRSAQLSDDGVYRYRLDRQWDKDAGFAVWIMLNPSTADAEVDDPTIRACMEFARRWELGGIVVVNLFAYRATDPDALYRLTEEQAIGGERNHIAIGQACLHADRVVAGWGQHGRLFDRGNKLLSTLGRATGIPVSCLAKNADGTPRHPLYVRRAAPLVHLA